MKTSVDAEALVGREKHSIIKAFWHLAVHPSDHMTDGRLSRRVDNNIVE